jgi:acetyl esterase
VTDLGYQITSGTVAGRDGEIPIRDYRPDTPGGASPFLWVHGGGFVAGGLDQKESDEPARYLAARGRWVRTLDYRLAPNIGLFGKPKPGAAPGRFPAAHHDILDVAAALRRESGKPIALGGASAGANLAAGVVLAMRDSGVELPRSLVIVYGVLHSVLPIDDDVESSLRGPIARWLFKPPLTRRMNFNYVGVESGLANPYAFPGAADLHGLPPTLTLDARNDRLRSSGHAFYERLTDSGVQASELVVDARHGFLNYPKRPAFDRGMTAIDEWLCHHDATK